MSHILANGQRPILNVTCPVVNLSLSLNCRELAIETTRECECACLALAGCATPRCAYAIFTRSCAEHGSCVDVCTCSEFLCSVDYTPRETTDYWAQVEREKQATDDGGLLTVIIFSSVMCVILVVLLVYERVRCAAREELPDEGIG